MAHPVILFDGDCNLCHGFVQWVIRHDAAGQFHFASLQSPVGADLLRQHGLPEQQLRTVVLSDGARCWVKSDAALAIFARLSGGWRLLRAARLLPKFFRDWVYDAVAVNRYRLFGRRSSCLLPEPRLRERLLA